MNDHVLNAERFVGHYVALSMKYDCVVTFSEDAKKSYMERRKGDRVVHKKYEVFFFESFVVKTDVRADISLIDSELRKRYLYLDDLFGYENIDDKLNNMFQVID